MNSVGLKEGRGREGRKKKEEGGVKKAAYEVWRESGRGRRRNSRDCRFDENEPCTYETPKQ